MAGASNMTNPAEDEWLIRFQPWLRLNPTNDPWGLLVNLGLCVDERESFRALRRTLFGDDEPEFSISKMGRFLTQDFRAHILLEEEIWKSSGSCCQALCALASQDRKNPSKGKIIGPAVVDMLARRIIAHGVPSKPILLRHLEGNIWFISVDDSNESLDNWGDTRLKTTSERRCAGEMLRLAGVLLHRDWREAVVRIERKTTMNRARDIFGGYWASEAEDLPGWVFELKS